MALSRPSLSDLVAGVRSDVETRVAGSTPGVRRSILGALATALAGAVHGVYGALSARASQSVPYTATGIDLEGWASIWGVTRKQPTGASGTATATGASGVLIPAGTRLQSAAGAVYSVDVDVSTVAGAAVLQLTAVEVGSLGNQPAGAVLTWVNTPTGLASTATVDADGLAGGANLESDDGLRARLLARIQAPGHGGNAADYLNWALEVPAITRAWVFPLYDGPGTVRLYVANDAYTGAELAAGGDVTAAQAYIDALKPVTADVEVVAPTAAPIDLTLSITPDTAETRAAVEAALQELLLREPVPEGGLSLNRLIVTIGSAGLDDFEMTSPVAAPSADVGELLTLGEITWV
ncbi:baseplate J/gp47 family protein [Stagnimonas aquatica]|uniref:Baseplate J/gp47 family protein n=1 Tax=Stagnimonas aquatica TaxID=2689987 RepID=A0A3N0V7H0_9GAMM|nr:baseplate J/gp47 family protein [Stagnimonas aquatica]ROH88673.1 baseplate J/gp47 family protein [Stagnimonas aquatica]